MVDGIDESNVKSCKWSVGNSDVVSKLSAVSGSKLRLFTQKAVVENKVQLSAKSYSKTKMLLHIQIQFIFQTLNRKFRKLIIYGTALGNERQQYISFKSLENISTITMNDSNKNAHANNMKRKRQF